MMLDLGSAFLQRAGDFPHCSCGHQGPAEPFETSYQEPASGRVVICDPRVTTHPEGCTWHVCLGGPCLFNLSGLPLFGPDFR